MKRKIIKLVQVLEKKNFIESKYKIFIKDQAINTNCLTIENISEGFIIYEKINV
jgi:hypothetical protein